MTPEQIAFTNSFNRQRSLLAGFSKCWSLEELHFVRDGLYLGLAADLLPEEYDVVHETVVTNPAVAATRDSTAGFATMIGVARSSLGWDALVAAVLKLAEKVDCDLTTIWKTLEDGRMEWLKAINGAQNLKELLQEALKRDTATHSLGDVNDAKMLWMYALSLNIPSLEAQATAWSKTVGMKDPLRPLVKYQAELWDPRKEEWRSLDLGVQAAAERGGSSIDEVWIVGLDGTSPATSSN